MNTSSLVSKPASRVLAALALATLAAAAMAEPPDRPGPGPGPGGPPMWFDGAHGHHHRYPQPGSRPPAPPRGAVAVRWGGVPYRFLDGVWYAPGARGLVVVHPPIGIVLPWAPRVATAVTIGGIAYVYANDVYYRPRPDGAYEVVPPPVQADPPGAAPAERLYVYPRSGQSPEQQAGDEYACHRWAAAQVGADPTEAAGGAAAVPPSQRLAYQRAQSACLEGRGYTVR